MPIRIAAALLLVLTAPASAAMIGELPGVTGCPGIFSPACRGPHEGGTEGRREQSHVKDHPEHVARPGQIGGRGGALGMGGGHGGGPGGSAGGGSEGGHGGH